LLFFGFSHHRDPSAPLAGHDEKDIGAGLRHASQVVGIRAALAGFIADLRPFGRPAERGKFRLAQPEPLAFFAKSLPMLYLNG
jgi:hypothetical protein